MALRIGDEVPDFTAETTEGRISFHDWIGDGWAILFSHPKDFTPVCTTELGYMAGLKPEFEKRNCKVIGLSIDSVDDHEAWSKDIEETQGHAVNYPIIGDTDLEVAKLFDMIHPNAKGKGEGAHRRRQRHHPVGVRDRPRQGGEAHAHLPHEHRAQLRRGAAGARFHAAHREAQGGDAGELEAGRGRHHRAGGVGRGGEGEVPRRMECAQSPTCAWFRSRSSGRSLRNSRRARHRRCWPCRPPSTARHRAGGPPCVTSAESWRCRLAHRDQRATTLMANGAGRHLEIRSATTREDCIG